MTYELYRYVFLGSLGLAVFFLLLSVFLFFKLRIPAIIAFLTGATERKGIEDIKKRTKQVPGGAASDGTKAKGARSVSRQAVVTPPDGPGIVTADLNKQPDTAACETTLLGQANGSGACETTLLSQGCGNGAPAGETTVLNAAAAPNVANETTVLSPPPAPAQMSWPMPSAAPAAREPVNQTPQAPRFEVAFEITYVSTEQILA